MNSAGLLTGPKSSSSVRAVQESARHSASRYGSDVARTEVIAFMGTLQISRLNLVALSFSDNRGIGQDSKILQRKVAKMFSARASTDRRPMSLSTMTTGNVESWAGLAKVLSSRSLQTFYFHVSGCTLIKVFGLLEEGS